MSSSNQRKFTDVFDNDYGSMYRGQNNSWFQSSPSSSPQLPSQVSQVSQMSFINDNNVDNNVDNNNINNSSNDLDRAIAALAAYDNDDNVRATVPDRRQAVKFACNSTNTMTPSSSSTNQCINQCFSQCLNTCTGHVTNVCTTQPTNVCTTQVANACSYQPIATCVNCEVDPIRFALILNNISTSVIFAAGSVTTIPLGSVSATTTTVFRLVSSRNTYLKIQTTNSTNRLFGKFYYRLVGSIYSNLSFNASFYFSMVLGVVYINIQNNSATNITLPIGINAIIFIGNKENNCCINNNNIPLLSRKIFFQNISNILITGFGIVVPNVLLTEADVITLKRNQCPNINLNPCVGSCVNSCSGSYIDPCTGQYVNNGYIGNGLTNGLIGGYGVVFRVYATPSGDNDIINVANFFERDPIATLSVFVTGDESTLTLTARVIRDSTVINNTSTFPTFPAFCDLDQVLIPANSLWIATFKDADISPIEVVSFGSGV